MDKDLNRTHTGMNKDLGVVASSSLRYFISPVEFGPGNSAFRCLPVFLLSRVCITLGQVLRQLDVHDWDSKGGLLADPCESAHY
jgi:hypothetical protein